MMLAARPIDMDVMILPAMNCPYRALPVAEVISMMIPMMDTIAAKISDLLRPILWLMYMASAHPNMIPAEPTPEPADCLDEDRVQVVVPLTVTESPYLHKKAVSPSTVPHQPLSKPCRMAPAEASTMTKYPLGVIPE